PIEKALSMPFVVIGLPRIRFVHLLSIMRQKDTGALFVPVVLRARSLKAASLLPSTSSSSVVSFFVLDL
ncbi:MAG TPA: hypothetical protein VI114_13040, partial [Chthoniobacterales bacterium]